jgi:hypothetical protein
MSPLDRHSKAITSSSVEGLPQGHHSTRPRRPDFNELTAQEYRRALRSLLRATCEHRLRPPL